MVLCGDAANDDGQRKVAGFPCTFFRPKNIAPQLFGRVVSAGSSLVSIDGSFIRHLGFPWEEDATLLYKLTSPAHLSGGRESLYRFAEALVD